MLLTDFQCEYAGFYPVASILIHSTLNCLRTMWNHIRVAKPVRQGTVFPGESFICSRQLCYTLQKMIRKNTIENCLRGMQKEEVTADFVRNNPEMNVSRCPVKLPVRMCLF